VDFIIRNIVTILVAMLHVYLDQLHCLYSVYNNPVLSLSAKG